MADNHAYAVIAFAVAAGSFLAMGWLAPVTLDAGAKTPVAPKAPVFVHPGAVVAEAARRLGASASAGDGALVDVDTSVDVTSSARQKATIADISAQFRRDLAAVVIENGTHAALLTTPGERARRVAVGGIYRDGWRLAAISADAVVLKRRHEARRIPLVGDAQVQAHADVVMDSASSVAREGPRERLVLSRQDARAKRP
jgi:hypothetical protein